MGKTFLACAFAHKAVRDRYKALYTRAPRLFRDLAIFQLKLFLDGLGDLVLSPLSFLAALWDMIPGGRKGRAFYAVLRLGERWDLWLNLYRPAKDAELSGEGLIGAGKAGADTFIGKVEEMVREKGWLERSGQLEATTDDEDWTWTSRSQE